MVDDGKDIYFKIPFSLEEMECRCGCGTVVRNVEFIKRLTAARWIAARPFYILSWTRCKKHNQEVGGVQNSAHLVGLAVDIGISSSRERYDVISALMAAGFNRIGIGNSFIHADLDRSKPSNVVWVYSSSKVIR